MPAPTKPENRIELVASFYDVPVDSVVQIAKLSQAERKPLCKELGLNPYILRTMLDYTRYFEAGQIERYLLSQKEDISRMSVVDFGCLVADYGIHFARLNAKVSVYDGEEAVKFASYRFAREGLPVTACVIPHGHASLVAGADLVVFGEVLEHIDNPLKVLEACVGQNVRYIFTSCYPFGDDKYFSLPGHRKSAQTLQPDCIQLLKNHYTMLSLHKKAVLWKRVGEAMPDSSCPGPEHLQQADAVNKIRG